MSTTRFPNTTKIGNSVFWVPSSSTRNMARELELVITSNPDCEIHISADTILLEGFGTGFTTIPTKIHVVAKSTTILQNEDSRCIDINNAVNASAEYSVSAIADDNTLHTGNLFSTKITLTAASSAEAHDIIAVYSSDAYPGSSGVEMGEAAQLVKDEQSGNNLYTTGNLSLTEHFTAGNTKVRILDKTRRFIWEGGRFKSNGDADDSTKTSRQECIRLIGYVDQEVKEAEFDAPWAQMIWFQCSARGRITDCKSYDVLNNAKDDTGAVSVQGFSYGAYFYGMNWGHVVDGFTAYNGRHPAYTSGSDASPSQWYEKGYPTKCTIKNVTGYNCYGALIDTHEEGADHTFINCIAYSSYEDQRESFDGRLGQSRAVRDTFINCHAFYGCGGISVDNINHNLSSGPNVVRLENCSFSYIKNNGESARAIDVDNQATTGRTKLELHNVSFYDCDKGIEVGKNTELSYYNLNFVRVDECILARDGSVSYGTNITADFINTSYSSLSKVWVVYSNDADTYVTCLGNNVVIKDTANLPREWFNEGDSSANTKYIWHGGITDCKTVDSTAAASATLSKQSGATTFTNRTTEIATVTL